MFSELLHYTNQVFNIQTQSYKTLKEMEGTKGNNK